MRLDAASDDYVRHVASVLAAVCGSGLTGVYLHGSAVLGGFDIRRSDLDVVVVHEFPMTASERSAAASQLSDERLPCPARGLELSIVTLSVAQHPTARPAFELHVTTAPEDTKVVDGHCHDGDPDLVLHFAVCREAGRLVGPGRPAAEVFAPVADELVLAQLVGELSWAATDAPGEYAVLNACRAWRFAVERTLVSKIDGGQWALNRVCGPDQRLIQTALNKQRGSGPAQIAPNAVAPFVRRILTQVEGASA